MALSEKSRAILQAIAKGHTYEQILVQDLAWTYHDIFQAAAEALEVGLVTGEGKSYSAEENHVVPGRLARARLAGKTEVTPRTPSKKLR